MVVSKRYALRLITSLKYVTAKVIDRTNGKIVTSASSSEQDLKRSFGRKCVFNVKAAAVVGEVLARRLKVDNLETGIHVDIRKEIERKGSENRSKVLAVVNALKDNGICLIPEEENHD